MRPAWCTIHGAAGLAKSYPRRFAMSYIHRMEGARSFARIVMALDKNEIAGCILDDEFPRIIRWLADFRGDELVKVALDRLLTAVRQYAN